MKTHWKKITNPEFIGAYELIDGTENPTLNVKILSVGQKVVVLAGGKKEELTIAELEGQKPMILNKTNCKTIEAIAKTPFIEEWKGLVICLFVKNVKFGSEWVDALRVREVKEKVKPILEADSDTYSKVLNAVLKGYTMDQVKGKYILSEEVESKILQDVIEKTEPEEEVKSE